MPKPESTEDLVTMIRDLRARLDRSERRDAFGDKRRMIAAAGGLTALPVLLADEDVRGTLPLTASYVDVALFAPAASGVLSVHCRGNGNTPGQFDFQLYHPASATVLATSTASVAYTPGGCVARATTGWINALAAADTVYDSTVYLRARYTNAATSRITIMSARWGVTNV